jgi:hypothetical protein
MGKTNSISNFTIYRELQSFHSSELPNHVRAKAVSPWEQLLRGRAAGARGLHEIGHGMATTCK